MRRLPILVVAVLAAIVLTLALLKCRALSRRRARAPRSAGPSLAASRTGDASGPVTLGRPDGSPGGETSPGDEPSPTDARLARDERGVRGARMLHGDCRHTARALGIAPRSPAVVWSRDVGGPIEAQVSTSLDERTLYVATLGGGLFALAASDGAVLWTVPLGDRAYATPCVGDDGEVFLGRDVGQFMAISPQGRVDWRLDTTGDADTAPAIAPDGTIVFASGATVYDLTPHGGVKWRFSARRKVFTGPAIAPAGRIFVGSQDHHAYALSPEGRPLWSADLGADVDAAAAIADDGAVFFGTDGGDVVRLDPDDGRVVWRTRVGGYVRGALSISRGGDVWAGVYGPKPRVVRLRQTDGLLAAEVAIPGTGSPDFGVHGGPIEDSAGTLLFGAQDDNLYAIDSGGNVLWRFTTGGDVDAPVTLLSDGTVLVGSDDGIVRALR